MSNVNRSSSNVPRDYPLKARQVRPEEKPPTQQKKIVKVVETTTKAEISTCKTKKILWE